ncbi:MAG TPA: hypothetical protein VLA96_09310 [Terriglobales bacterium]|nr:hypothetical protein [Terriglobales bacterium]
MKRQLALLLLVLVPALAAAQRRTASAVTIPAGTQITVRMIDKLTSETAQPGQTFRGSLEYPILVSGREVLPRGADVEGRVIAAHKSGRLSDPGVLELELTSVGSGTKKTEIATERFVIKGESHTKSNVTKIGGGAALGAIIGGIAGGGKGAAIGAGAGAAAGTGVAAATGKKNASVDSEAVLNWNTATDAVVGRAAGSGSVRPASAREVEQRDPASLRSFTARDRATVRTCYEDHAGDLPPGLAKRENLPPGLEKQLQKNGTLPPGLQRRVHDLPEVCERQLPTLPRELERVVYMRRVMLLDREYRILDAFDIDE